MGPRMRSMVALVAVISAAPTFARSGPVARCTVEVRPHIFLSSDGPMLVCALVFPDEPIGHMVVDLEWGSWIRVDAVAKDAAGNERVRFTCELRGLPRSEICVHDSRDPVETHDWSSWGQETQGALFSVGPGWTAEFWLSPPRTAGMSALVAGSATLRLLQ